MIKIAANSVWPGVYVSINDNSNVYSESLPGAIGFMCLLSEKGPDNRPVMVTSVSDLLKTYGSPSPRKYGQAWYVAKEYLETLSNLFVMRVLPKNATYATLALKLKQNPDEITKYRISKVKDEEGNIKEVLTEISSFTSEDKVVTVDELNSDTTIANIINNAGADNIIFPATEINRSAHYTADVTLVGAEGGAPATEEPRAGNETIFNGAIDGDTTLRLDGFTLSQYAFSNNYSNTSEVSVRNCRVMGLEGGNTTVPEEFEEGNLPVAEEEDIPVKTVTNRSFFFQNIELGNIKSVPEIKTALNGEDSDADIVFYPYGRGEYYNKLGIKLTKAKKSYEGAFIIDIYEMGKDSSYANLVESFTVSFDIDAKDISGSSIFIKDVLDMYSDYIKCEVSNNIGQYAEDLEENDGNDINVLTNSYDDLAMTTIEYLSGGTDGSMYDKNGNLDWNVEVSLEDEEGTENMTMALANAYCGLNINPETGEANEEITDTENMDFTVVFDAGWPTPVKDAIVDLCDSRQSCFGFLDNGVAAENGNRSEYKLHITREKGTEAVC